MSRPEAVQPRAAWYVVIYACALHYIWAILLVVSITAAHSTPVSLIADGAGGRYAAAALLAASAALAQLAPWLRRVNVKSELFALIPQQLLLLMSAGAGVHAAAAGHYADGVPRPWPFILADQMPVILVALLYTTALLYIGRRA